MTTDKPNKELHSAISGMQSIDPHTSDAGLNNQKGGDPYGSIYQCQVKCEGSKTYEQPLNCPVCNEKMILIVS